MDNAFQDTDLSDLALDAFDFVPIDVDYAVADFDAVAGDRNTVDRHACHAVEVSEMKSTVDIKLAIFPHEGTLPAVGYYVYQHGRCLGSSYQPQEDLTRIMISHILPGECPGLTPP